MQCIHTGIQLIMGEYRMLIRGDYFTCAGVHIFRLANNSAFYPNDPELPKEYFKVIHGEVKKIAHWFDQHKQDAYSTLIVEPQDFIYFGIEGYSLDTVL